MLIEITDLKLSIRSNRILDGVNITMGPGDIYGLLGPNGAGKSTSISVVTGLRSPDSGEVRVLGLEPARNRFELHRKIGVLAEDSGFYGWMSAPDYLSWLARLYGRELSRDDAARRLEQVGLKGNSQQLVGDYSRGMRQRLGLARALLNDPRLLVLDEPTNGLDPRGRREIHDLLLALSREQQVGILLSTHILDDVDRLCDRIGIINRGKTLLEGNLAEILAKKSGANRYRLRIGTRTAPATDLLPQGVKLLSQDGGWIHLHLAPTLAPNTAWRTMFDAGWDIIEIHGEGDGLEKLYLDLTEIGVSV